MSRVVVITGASEGIGAVLARQLAAQGDSVVLAARRGELLGEICGDIGENSLPVAADVTVFADHERVRTAALDRFGHIDVWVNNAGRGVGIRTLDLTEEQFDEIMAVNLKSAWYGMKAIIPYFQSRGQGHLINVSSMLGRVPTSTLRSAYSAAKAALNSLTANVRMDLRADYPDIHVTLVMPGPVSTAFHANALGGTPSFTGRNASVQSADDVALAIVQVIAHPVAEAYTNPSSAALVQRYFSDVAGFEDTLFNNQKH